MLYVGVPKYPLIPTAPMLGLASHAAYALMEEVLALRGIGTPQEDQQLQLTRTL